MRNRIVGFMILGIAALLGVITYSFNKALTKIVNTACTHGSSCPMWGTIEFQTNISLILMAFVILIGAYLIFFGKEKIITKIRRIRQQTEPRMLKKEDYQEILSSLSDDEKAILEKIIDAHGTIFQSELVDTTKFSKTKVTRLLDILEGRKLIERKRRGMTNVVILK